MIRRPYRRPICTKWYRAPEIILLQCKPSTINATDTWSIGAIFAELLQMQRENRPDPTKRGPIFPGDACYPLSIGDQMDYASRVDQMQVIFDIVGSPDESEIVKLKDEKAIKYLRNLPQRKKRDLRRMFLGSGKHALDLFAKLVKFDVDKRISIKDAMEHEYFKEYKAMVEVDGDNEIKIKSMEDLDHKLSMKCYRGLILEEVLKYNKDEEIRFLLSGAMNGCKIDVIVDGYVRKYILPVLNWNTVIPRDILSLLCVIFEF